MKNKNIIDAWDEILPDNEIKEKMFGNIQQKYRQKSKWQGFKPTKILATAAAILFFTEQATARWRGKNFYPQLLGEFELGLAGTSVEVEEF